MFLLINNSMFKAKINTLFVYVTIQKICFIETVLHKIIFLNVICVGGARVSVLVCTGANAGTFKSKLFCSYRRYCDGTKSNLVRGNNKKFTLILSIEITVYSANSLAKIHLVITH